MSSVDLFRELRGGNSPYDVGNQTNYDDDDASASLEMQSSSAYHFMSNFVTMLIGMVLSRVVAALIDDFD